MSRVLTLAAFLLLAVAGPASAGPGQAAGYRHYKSGPVQVTADGSTVWIANQLGDSVTRIDTTSGTAAHFDLPDPLERDAPRGLAVTDDGSRVWVTAFESDRLYVLNGVDGQLVRTIDLPWGSGPYSVAVSPPAAGREDWALVTLHRGAALAAVNTATYEVVHLAPVYKSPFGISFTGDGTSAWITHLFVDGEHPHLTRVDFTGRIPVVASHFNGFAASPQMSASLTADDSDRNVAEGGYLNFRGHPAEIPSITGKNQLWIPTQYHNQSEDRPSPDSAIQATIRKLDLDSRTLSNVDKVILTAKQVHDPARGNNNPPWLGYGWDAGVSGLVDIGFTERAGDGPTAVLVAEQSDDVIIVPWDTPAVGSSRVDLQACKLEYSIVSPK